MAQQKNQKNITTLKPVKILDLETKRMIQYVSVTTKTTPDKKYNCWWCTLQIEDDPIGCPIKFEKDTYYTEGLFCCLNCIKAYVIEYGRHDQKFKNSIRLLALMACDIKGTELGSTPISIQPSPPWRFLTQFGGHISPEHYKELIDKIVYIEKGIIQVQPITILYEEEEKF